MADLKPPLPRTDKTLAPPVRLPPNVLLPSPLPRRIAFSHALPVPQLPAAAALSRRRVSRAAQRSAAPRHRTDGPESPRNGRLFRALQVSDERPPPRPKPKHNCERSTTKTNQKQNKNKTKQNKTKTKQNKTKQNKNKNKNKTQHKNQHQNQYQSSLLPARGTTTHVSTPPDQPIKGVPTLFTSWATLNVRGECSRFAPTEHLRRDVVQFHEHDSDERCHDVSPSPPAVMVWAARRVLPRGGPYDQQQLVGDRG